MKFLREAVSSPSQHPKRRTAKKMIRLPYRLAFSLFLATLALAGSFSALSGTAVFAASRPLQPGEQKMILDKVLAEAVRKGFLQESSVQGLKNQITPLLSIRGLLPDAIAIGFMTRCQAVVGACLASQVNIGIVDGKIHLSELQIIGGELGDQVAANIESYVAVCYGLCNDEEASGWFVGTDATATAGLGVHVFMDYGLDWSDLWGAKSLDDMVRSTVFYAGVGITTGAGVGMSVGVIRYRVSNVQKIDFKDFGNIHLF
ncbi:MAG: hypothetical protein EBX52_09140 [Proteobacteria bacterium]|nr:hypothetical protein [Pseudomonadota bacterium]